MFWILSPWYRNFLAPQSATCPVIDEIPKGKTESVACCLASGMARPVGQ
jgi:hypothetical protein